MTLSDAQVERYSRQIILPEVGARGQARLLGMRVTLAGAGEAAALAATLLGRAGLGALDVVGEIGPLAELAPDCHLTSWRDAAALPAADVVVDLAGNPALTRALGERHGAAGRPFVLGRIAGANLEVATLVGRPCVACHAPSAPRAEPAGALAAPATLVLGALAASEALAALWAPPSAGRLQTLALGGGHVASGPLGPTAGCARCGGGGA